MILKTANYNDEYYSLVNNVDWILKYLIKENSWSCEMCGT